MPPVNIMIKPVSSACNMRCGYCFYADVAARREQADYGAMDQETMRELVRKVFLYADGSVAFSFQGGEPTLAGLPFYRAFIGAVRQYNSRSLPVTYALQTNGYAIDDGLLDFFAQQGFLLGVSLDGTRAAHDGCRKDRAGNGTYDRVRENIARIRARGIAYNILCVVTASLAAQGKACWDSLKEHQYLQFIPCIDDFSGTPGAYSLSAEAYGRFLIETFGCYEKAYYSGHPVSERRFDNYIGILLGRQPEACGMNGVCGQYFVAEADGGIYPCDFYVLDRWRMGNIHESSLRRMVGSEAALEFRRSSLAFRDACAHCPWAFLCRGGCRRDRESTDRKNRFCKSYTLFFDACYDRMQRLAEAVAKRQAR